MAAKVRCIFASFSRRRFSGEQALALGVALRTFRTPVRGESSFSRSGNHGCERLNEAGRVRLDGRRATGDGQMEWSILPNRPLA